MKGINHPVTVLIPIKQGKQLTASLKTEDSLANIRIKQIFTPDEKSRRTVWQRTETCNTSAGNI